MSRRRARFIGGGLALQVATLLFMGGSTTVLTGCPDDACSDATYDNEDCTDDDGDGYCEVCCSTVNADGSLCLEDCDDTDPWTHPNAADSFVDGLDANCDGIDGPPPTQTPTAEVCDNGIDDDLNGQADCADGACYHACTESWERACDAAIVLGEGVHSVAFSASADRVTTCGQAEQLFRFDAAEAGQLSISIDKTEYVKVLTTCGLDASACELPFGGDRQTIRVEAGPVYIAVGAYVDTTPFTITTEFRPLACGDGIVTGDEQCDDGGVAIGDGCDANCAIEYFYDTCTAAAVLEVGTTPINTVETGTNMVESTCGAVDTPEYLHVFYPPSDGTLSVALENGGPAALYVRNVCTVEPIDAACRLADEASPALLHVPATAGVPIYVFVDGFDIADNGAQLTALFNAH